MLKIVASKFYQPIWNNVLLTPTNTYFIIKQF